MLFVACNNDDLNGSNIKIGDEYQGGIVYYILKEEDKGYISEETHGLIASFEEIRANEDENFWWYCFEDVSSRYNPQPRYYDLELIGADGDAIGDGKENTSKIINYCTDRNGVETIANICDNYAMEYEGVVYNDWFLPSKGEVEVMVAIDDNANENALDLEHTDGYPSSTEESSKRYFYVERWIDQCGTPGNYDDACASTRIYQNQKDTFIRVVRPIRYF